MYVITKKDLHNVLRSSLIIHEDNVPVLLNLLEGNYFSSGDIVDSTFRLLTKCVSTTRANIIDTDTFDVSYMISSVSHLLTNVEYLNSHGTTTIINGLMDGWTEVSDNDVNNVLFSMSAYLRDVERLILTHHRYYGLDCSLEYKMSLKRDLGIIVE